VRSNTPIQSLVLANDTQFLECARALAIETFGSEDADWPARIERAFRTCLGRRPNEAEGQRLLQLVIEQVRVFEQDPPAAQQLTGESVSNMPPSHQAAWAAVCRVLLNLDEFITRE
jgi:hypothetical protein